MAYTEQPMYDNSGGGGGGGGNQPRELCRAFRNNGRCRYGDSCQFEHSEGEPILPPVCFAFRDSGACDHGDECRFLHGDNDVRDFSRGNKNTGTKMCSNCNQDLMATMFSQNQWRKPASKARSCKTCLENMAPAQRNGGGGGNSSGKACWNCNQTGHLSRDCPEPENADAKKPKSRRSNGRGQKCFNCGEFGHISAECPNKAMGPKCYNCGNFGHISAECPSKDLGPKCYNCQQFGHISSACQQAPVDNTAVQQDNAGY